MRTLKLALPFAASTIALFAACTVDLNSKKSMDENTIEMIDFTKKVSNKSKRKKEKHLNIKHDISDSLRNQPTALILFESIEKYSKEFDIPKHIMFNIAFKETSYQGPLHKEYVGRLTSPSGALGPMQVMTRTASFVQKTNVTPQKLKDDIDFNVQTSAKLLKYLYEKYNDWKLVCGAYNTGRPVINKYAIFCNENVDYEKNWNIP
jgi:hypothetical protein